MFSFLLIRQSRKFLPFHHRCQKVSFSTEEGAVSKVYDPAGSEEAVRARWKERKPESKNLNGKSFHDDPLFRMILPPPNVTGKLHLGHALTVAIQDSIMRWKYMTGSAVKWIPGFDHAGIATQSVVTRKIVSQQTSSKSSKEKRVSGPPIPIDPAVLKERLKEFAAASQVNISGQLEKIGTVLDWDSSYYTLNDSHRDVVQEAFISLFETGYIRRGDGIINWCSTLRSTVSDVECVPTAFDGKIAVRVPDLQKAVDFGLLFFVKYKIEGSDESLLVATSRPETIFGDVAVAVNPKDQRFSHLIGKRVINPLNQRPLPVIPDERVKVDFGSGALKVTPAHDKTDFKIGVDHSLEVLTIFTKDGHMNEECGDLKGLHRFAARKAVIKRLTQVEAVTEVKEYKGSLDLCSRTGDVVESRILPHWFMETRQLSDKILQHIESNQLSIEPEYQKGNFLHCLNTSLDWCLSRQIQWGHPIPAYYHVSHPGTWVAAYDEANAKKKLEQKLGMTMIAPEDVRQDQDVLDTWFSSALIPLAVSGWPDISTKDYKELSLMETGNDILLFWVWRMLLMNLALVDRLPFRHVVLHGLVTDPQGRKMSKSKGNVVDPLHVIDGRSYDELVQDAETSFKNGELDENEYKLRLSGLKKYYPKGFSKCGADALRFVLLSQDIYKQDIKLDATYLENCRHFMNKIWQAMRFYFHHSDKGINHPTMETKPDPKICISIADRWILACLYKFTATMETSIPECDFHKCMSAIREFLYLQLCDVYIELVKEDLQKDVNSEVRVLVMRYVLLTALKLSHPFLPFVTEEMWFQLTQDNGGLLRDSSYPASSQLLEFKNEALIESMAKGLKVVNEIRSLRTKSGCSKKETVEGFLEVNPKDPALAELLGSIETITNSKIQLEPPLRTHRHNLFSHTFDLEQGTTCRLSLLKTIDTESTSAINSTQILKLKAKLEKLGERLKSLDFLKGKKANSADEIKRKMEVIRNQLAEISENSSSKKQ